MALEDILKGFDGGLAGIAAGVGAAILAPVVVPLLAEVGKPLTKAAIKEGILLYEKTKEALAEVTEVFEDIVAEAKAELAEEQHTGKDRLAENPVEVVPITD